MKMTKNYAMQINVMPTSWRRIYANCESAQLTVKINTRFETTTENEHCVQCGWKCNQSVVAFRINKSDLQLQLVNGLVKLLDLERFDRLDQSSPMKKKTFVSFILPWHTLLCHCAIIPQFLLIGYRNVYIICLMGVACKNLFGTSVDTQQWA